jgi:hypothetical protein
MVVMNLVGIGGVFEERLRDSPVVLLKKGN